MGLDLATCYGWSVDPPVTPVCPEAPVSPVMPLAPASDGALRANYPSLAQLTQLLGMRLAKMASCDGRSVHPPVTPV